MNPLSGQSTELVLLKVTASTAGVPGEYTVVSSSEDGVDIARSLVSQLAADVLGACVLGACVLEACVLEACVLEACALLVARALRSVEPAPTAGPAAAEADCPAMETIPRHSAINSAARVRTPPPPPSFKLLQSDGPHAIRLGAPGGRHFESTSAGNRPHPAQDAFESAREARREAAGPYSTAPILLYASTASRRCSIPG